MAHPNTAAKILRSFSALSYEVGALQHAQLPQCIIKAHKRSAFFFQTFKWATYQLSQIKTRSY